MNLADLCRIQALPSASLGCKYCVTGIQGAWRTVLERLKDFRQNSSEAELLSNAAWYILALSKLRMYTACAEELALLGPLDAPHYAEPTPHGAPHFSSAFFSSQRILPASVRHWLHVPVVHDSAVAGTFLAFCYGEEFSLFRHSNHDLLLN